MTIYSSSIAVEIILRSCEMCAKMFLRGLASPGAHQTAFGGRECRGGGGDLE
jgi:hypothetical protein